MMNEKLILPGKWDLEFDEKGDCVASHCDAAYRSLLGLQAGEAISDVRNVWKELIHPEDAERFAACFADCIAAHPQGKDLDLEYRVRTGKGDRLFHDPAVVSRRADGTPIRMDGILFDLQELASHTDERTYRKADRYHKAEGDAGNIFGKSKALRRF